MRKHILYSICFLFCNACFSQTSNQIWSEKQIKHAEICGGVDSILNRKGKWKRTTDDLAFPDKNLPRNQYGQVNARLDKIFPFFAEACPDLRGIEPTWQRGIRGNSFVTGGPVPYSISSSYFTYYCNSNYKKIVLGDETRNWVYVFINSWGWLCDKLNDWDINNDGKMVAIYILPPKVGEWKGRSLYAPAAHHSSNAIVIGHDGKLPWHTLTQKQYLSGLKNMLTDKKNKDLESYDALEVKLKQKFETGNKNISAEQLEKINQQRQEDLKKYLANKENFKSQVTQTYEEGVKYIDDYIAATTNETLEKPAIIDPKFNTYGFKGVFGDEKKGGIKLVAFSTKYFKKDLASYVPQFMVLYWFWSSDPISLGFKKQFEENFPLDKLKGMIDK